MKMNMRRVVAPLALAFLLIANTALGGPIVGDNQSGTNSSVALGDVSGSTAPANVGMRELIQILESLPVASDEYKVTLSI